MYNQKNAVQQTFSSSSHNYVTSELHAKGKDLASLVTEISTLKPKSLLDIAVGAGHVSNAVAPYVEDVTAMDLTDEMLSTAEAFVTSNGHRNVKFERGDAESLSYESDTFDVSVCRIAAHHFEHPIQFLESVQRVTKSGGLFYLLDNTAPEVDEYDQFYNEIEKMRDPSHYRAWKKSEWIAMIERAGLVVEHLERYPKVFQFDDWCERLNLSNERRHELTERLKSTNGEQKQKFTIEIDQNGDVQSFSGESVLIRARKL
ncbi:hypothetical protein DH09_10520 [Bacillaceae bacterium JMAK1]|nr:hypothetical protein DH09_10520 [Bacillaceae bacterium JMAK1]